MDRKQLAADLIEYYQDILDGKIRGISTGFPKLDKQIGRIEPSQIWVVGGKSGVGKTFFAQNIIENIVDTSSHTVNLYTTELSAKAYAIRHAMMRAGLYKLQFEQSPQVYKDKVGKEFAEYIMKTTNLDIIPVSSFDEIVEHLSTAKPDIVVIDYVQELSVGGQLAKADAMPLVGAKLKQLAMSTGVAFIVVSQVKNGVLEADAYTTQQTPFDFGKELNNAAHNSIWLQRKKDANGEVEPILTAVITKARDGELGAIDFDVLPGYKLKQTYE